MVGGEQRQYPTSLCDAHRFPAREVAAHYTQRWEIELGFREIKQGVQRNATTLRLSFQWLAVAITTALYHWPLQTPGTFPKRLARLREQARVSLLPERRKRSYPRVVKQPRSTFPMKNASQLN